MDTVKSGGGGSKLRQGGDIWKVHSANSIRCMTDEFVWGEDGQIGVERQEWPRLKGSVLFQRLGYSFNFRGRDTDWEQGLHKTGSAWSCLPATTFFPTLSGIYGLQECICFCFFFVFANTDNVNSCVSLHYQPSSCPSIEAVVSLLLPYRTSLQMHFFTKGIVRVYHCQIKSELKSN